MPNHTTVRETFGGTRTLNLLIVLERSDNTYLTYPCVGLLAHSEMTLAGTPGNNTMFRRQQPDGCFAAPVRANHPEFRSVRPEEIL